MFGLIDNPVSGGGVHEELIRRIESAIAKRGEQCRIFATQAEGDGERQARAAIEAGCTDIAVVGGDGSLSDAVRALAGSGSTLYIVPCGTGNDFARTLALPKNPFEAFVAQLDGEYAQIDCGTVNGKPFINVAGTGFDVEVLRRTEELKDIYPGEQAYRRAVISVLSKYEAMETEVSVDEAPFFRQRMTIVEAANGRFFGGGMQIAPNAKVNDALLDIVQVGRVPRWAIPFLLPLLIAGLHVHIPVVKVCRAKSVTIRRKGMVVNIDGRLEAMDEARFEVLPGALRVKRPAKKAR